MKNFPDSHLNKLEVLLGGRIIGPNNPVYIIAEAGVAHFGSLDTAFRMIDIAVQAGADAVKFQLYKTDRLIADSEYEWKERLSTKELPFHDFLQLKKYANDQNIDFFVTVHEESALDYAIETLELKVIKIGSGEVGNLPFLKKIAQMKYTTIVSLGLHGEDEIGQVVRVFEQEGNNNLILLHCVTRYPTPPEECNLKTMLWLQKKYSYPIGYSDHAVGHAISLAAVAMGACVIEKHFFIDRNIKGSQDAYGACDKTDLGEFVSSIRVVEAALGEECSNPNVQRFQNLSWARKSISTARSLGKGHCIIEKDIVFKRPGSGIPPKDLNNVLGKTLLRSVAQDHIIRWDDLK